MLLLLNTFIIAICTFLRYYKEQLSTLQAVIMNYVN